MTHIRIVETKKAPLPAGTYSQAVIADKLIFCSGQIALDQKTGKIIPGKIKDQTYQVLENIKAVLQEAGAELGRVVKVDIFLKDIKDFDSMNEVYGAYFSSSQAPARSTVEVSALPKGALIEISCLAYKT